MSENRITKRLSIPLRGVKMKSSSRKRGPKPIGTKAPASGTDTKNSLPETATTPATPKQEGWGNLSVGVRVRINIEGEEVPGIVDALMHDASAVWIWTENGNGRRLIHCQDGVEVHPCENTNLR